MACVYYLYSINITYSNVIVIDNNSIVLIGQELFFFCFFFFFFSSFTSSLSQFGRILWLFFIVNCFLCCFVFFLCFFSLNINFYSTRVAFLWHQKNTIHLFFLIMLWFFHFSRRLRFFSGFALERCVVSAYIRLRLTFSLAFFLSFLFFFFFIFLLLSCQRKERYISPILCMCVMCKVASKRENLIYVTFLNDRITLHVGK